MKISIPRLQKSVERDMNHWQSHNGQVDETSVTGVAHGLPCRTEKVAIQSPSAPIRMMAEGDKGGFFSNLNPFKSRDKAPEPQTTFSEPQPGDPGYKPAESKATGGVKLPVSVGDAAASANRGLELLRQDIFKSAPERAGVGRQDQNLIIKPQFGDPGYKPQAYEVTKASELGISSFSDDKNYVGKVGGLDAVKKAAKDAQKGKAAAEIKREMLKAKAKEEPKVYDIPDYLKPIPEDTPRKRMTWKNYEGR